jgi:two-component system, OmpR family, sensor kinase
VTGTRPRLAAALRRGVAPLTRRLQAMPLQARLIGIVAALLALSLVAVVAASLAVLRPVLVRQVDERLPPVDRITDVVLDAQREGGHGRRGPVPSDYVIQVSDADGDREFFYVGLDNDDAPALPGLDLSTVERSGGRPFTVGDYRAVALPVTLDGEPATVAVALPLDGVDRSLERLRARLLAIGALALAACLLLGWVAVRRAFRPLHDIEAVAVAFGAGDTSHRVRTLPPTTEVGRLGEAVNGMLDRIESSLAAREASEQRMRRFVADASHELRTPLAAVRGFAELHRQGAVREPDDVAQAMRRIEDESTRMGGLVEDLLVLARLDEQRPLGRGPVDLLVLAADAVVDARALAPDRPVRLTGLDGDPAPRAATLVGDDARLRQVLANLVANAVRHTPAGTPLEVGVGVRAGWAVAQVVDHGPGIPPQEAHRVFERFYRTDVSRRRGGGGGSGLGLAIVAAVVQAHGGAVRVVPTPGGGATFEVALPAVPPSPDEGEADDADSGD